MTVELTPRTLLRSAPLSVMNVPGAAVALDAQAPNWIASDDRGLSLLAAFDGRTPLGRIVTDYATQSGLDVVAAWLHVDTFARDALRQGHRHGKRDGGCALPRPVSLPRRRSAPRAVDPGQRLL